MVSRLFTACVNYLDPDQLELPMGLVSRLVLGDSSFVTQFAQAVKDEKVFLSLSSHIVRMFLNHCVLSLRPSNS